MTGDNGSKTNPNVKQTIIVQSVTKPTKYRLFKAAGGIRKYKVVEVKSKFTEVIIVAKAKARKKSIEDEDLEALEALEELDDLDEDEDEEEIDEVDEDEEEYEEDEEDEDEDEGDEEDDEDDEDEEPAPKRRNKPVAKKTPSKSAGKRGSRPDDGKVGTQEVAAHFGVDGRALRIVLRKHGIEKDSDSSQYRWSSLKHPEVVKIGKLLKSGAAKAAQKEQFDNLKAKSAAKKSTAAKATAKKKRAAK